MDTSNTIKTPGQGSAGQVKSDDLRKTGKGMPDEKVKKDLGSQEPRRFGQNPVGALINPNKNKNNNLLSALNFNALFIYAYE